MFYIVTSKKKLLNVLYIFLYFHIVISFIHYFGEDSKNTETEANFAELFKKADSTF